jgi:hypothetical protein
VAGSHHPGLTGRRRRPRPAERPTETERPTEAERPTDAKQQLTAGAGRTP